MISFDTITDIQVPTFVLAVGPNVVIRKEIGNSFKNYYGFKKPFRATAITKTHTNRGAAATKRS